MSEDLSRKDGGASERRIVPVTGSKGPRDVFDAGSEAVEGCLTIIFRLFVVCVALYVIAYFISYVILP